MVARSEMLLFKAMHLDVTLKKSGHDIINSDFNLRVLKKKNKQTSKRETCT